MQYTRQYTRRYKEHYRPRAEPARRCGMHSCCNQDGTAAVHEMVQLGGTEAPSPSHQKTAAGASLQAATARSDGCSTFDGTKSSTHPASRIQMWTERLTRTCKLRAAGSDGRTGLVLRMSPTASTAYASWRGVSSTASCSKMYILRSSAWFISTAIESTILVVPPQPTSCQLHAPGHRLKPRRYRYRVRACQEAVPYCIRGIMLAGASIRAVQNYGMRYRLTRAGCNIITHAALRQDVEEPMRHYRRYSTAVQTTAPSEKVTLPY